jgi:DeoR family glucitol operon repressor
MKSTSRQLAIIEYLHRHGRSQIDELADYFNVSGATIRKDVIRLAQDRNIVRYRGAVELYDRISGRSLDSKSHIHSNEKHSIAKTAAAMICEGDSVILDAGSTVLQMTQFLNRFNNLTIMTNSLLTLNELAEFENDHTILMPGGTYRANLSSFQGELTKSTFEKCSFDKLFIGADGVDLQTGVTTFCEAYSVTAAMCQAAKQIILLIDSSKFGRKSPNIVCRLDRIDTIITDAGISSSMQEALVQQGTNVVIA